MPFSNNPVIMRILPRLQGSLENTTQSANVSTDVLYHKFSILKGQFHGFAHVQALALAVVNVTVSY